MPGMQWDSQAHAANGNGTPAADGDGDDPVVPVTIEVCLKETSTASAVEVQAAVAKRLEGQTLWYVEGPLNVGQADDPFLRQHVHCICICDPDPELQSKYSALLSWQYAASIYVYQLNDEGPADDDEGEEGVPSYREWALPAREFEGMWDSLYYESSIKRQLLKYAASALLFSRLGVDSHKVSWNRLVLLHGPPGTGKTSLCKALAQKLMIQFQQSYSHGQLVEVNAHSLFSKWFSESGKLVSKLFSKIGELVEEEDSLVFVLIDEVESLTAARKAAVGGSEPSDAIRAVNALLTQLDGLRHHPNVMVLTTSNITEAIDLAFVDRADIKAYIGPPGVQARYEILRSSLQELIRVGVVAGRGSVQLLPYRDMANASCSHPGGDVMEDEAQSLTLSQELARAATACEGFSGRSLRKLPFLAHANAEALPTPCPCLRFLQALQAAALKEGEDRAQLTAC